MCTSLRNWKCCAHLGFAEVFTEDKIADRTAGGKATEDRSVSFTASGNHWSEGVVVNFVN